MLYLLPKKILIVFLAKELTTDVKDPTEISNICRILSS